VAFSRGTALIDLRIICSEDGDYANPIEPSVQGGLKIARAIASLARTGHGAGASIVVTDGQPN
jgi:hypothetical protein